MNDLNYWERFLMTGSVQDFLAYKGVLRDEEVVSKDSRPDREEGEGEDSHAGIYRDYGNDFKG